MQPTEKSGRQIIMEKLNKAIAFSTTGDLQRAAIFLEQAREVRMGKKGARSKGRQDFTNSRVRKVDRPVSW